jgi:hypothetical protein
VVGTFVSSRDELTNCTFLATATHLDPMNAESDIARRLRSASGDTVLVSDPQVAAPSVELFRCGPAASPPPVRTSSKVRVVGGMQALKGCTYVAELDPAIACPDSYPAGRRAWRTAPRSKGATLCSRSKAAWSTAARHRPYPKMTQVGENVGAEPKLRPGARITSPRSPETAARTSGTSGFLCCAVRCAVCWPIGDRRISP